jgi:diadenylate cyclase
VSSVGLGWRDLLDVAVIAVLIFAALRLVRRTRARPALLGLGLLGGVYVLARQLGLTLTAALLQAFFAVFVVVLVVVFQDDLRRFFEALGSWRPGARPPAPHAGNVDLLARAAARLASTRTGALVVIPGTEPLERHLEGGIPLGGRLSEPLLLSLFDPGSPGHDGAVVVRGDRVERFAVHLPLSSNRDALGGAGTRHAAALGLSERCDALCIVVSEERGTISLASGGVLRTLASSGDLAAALRNHAGDAPTRDGAPDAAWAWREGLLAVALAVVLWILVVPGSAVTEVRVEAPVSVENLPDGWRLDAVDPPTLEVTLSGRRRDLLFTPDEEVHVNVDALLVKLGRRTFEVDVDAVQSPPGLTALRVEPERVRLSLSRADADSP